jgi:glycyl-radical enzyme activating protein family
MKQHMKTGIIFSIEEFAIHDGPGIRTTFFLKGCPLRCVWCHNPEGISPQPQFIQKKEGKTRCGTKVTTEELVDYILKNKDLYIRTGGGITLTGGEPLMQSDFIIELMQNLPGIHKAIETCGYVPENVFQSVVSLADLILFDVKHPDSSQHRKYTGKGNELILRNLRYLCNHTTRFIVRIPLIPGVNDTRDNMQFIADFVKGAPNLLRIELLRYHKTAGAKYKMTGKKYNPPFDTTKEPQVYSHIFEEYNIKTLTV